MDKLDKIKGCIFGLAIGDSLGAPVEFNTKDEINRKHGVLKELVGGGWLSLKPGEFTDDTQMALCLANSLIDKDKFDIEDISKRYIEWKKSDPLDIGNTTREAIKNLEKGSSPINSGIPAPQAGNGSVMRCAPLGIAASSSKNLEKYSEIESAITHSNPICTRACALVNFIISKLISGDSLKDIIELISQDSYYSDFVHIINTITLIDSPSGYVLDTLKAVFYALNTNDNFESTLITVVNLGGDADTTGAICGSIAGACYGFSSIPKRWLDKIDSCEDLERVSIGLFKLSNKEI